MRIASNESLSLSSEYRQFAGREVNEALDMRHNGQRLQINRHERSEIDLSSDSKSMLAADQRAVSDAQLQQLQQGMPQAPAESLPMVEGIDFSLSEESLYKLRMLLAALGRLSEEADVSLRQMFDLRGLPGPYQPAPVSSPAPAAQADWLTYRYDVTEWRGEELAVKAAGRVTTADGRRIDFDLSVEMRRVESSYTSAQLRAGAALKDPLVLNLNGGPVGLDNRSRIAFDLDADGRTDSVASLAPGSAFLALDRNGNGQIDDGRELFGALSGDGFADLSAYDEDGNGFIDEGDSVFSQLRLWRPGAQDGGELVDLLSAGVGALGLARAYGDFDLTANNQLEGRVRSTGLFLFENGQVGSMQQIDMAV